MKKWGYILIVAAMAVAGCVREETTDSTFTDSVRLSGVLSGTRTSPMPASRAFDMSSGVIEPAADVELNIGLFRIDQNKDYSYPAFLSCGEPLEATMGRCTSAEFLRDIEFTSVAQFFRNATDEIKYVAWSPWQTPTATNGYSYATDSGDGSMSVHIPLNGCTDVMYSSVATGTQSSGFNVMNFSHALCVYRVYAYAMVVPTTDVDGNIIEDDANNTGAVWGKLQEMTIHSVSKGCSITMPTDDSGLCSVAFDAVEAGVAGDLLLHETDGVYFEADAVLPVGLAARRLVAKFIAPPPESAVLNIGLKTDNAGTSQLVSIARNFKPGHAYDIVLRFSDHGIINATTSVSEWTTYEDHIDSDVNVGASEMFLNLNRYETSNCYTINSANYNYCFDTTVMGNGNGTPVGVADTSLNVEGLGIIWDETYAISNEGGNTTFTKKSIVSLAYPYPVNGRALLCVKGDEEDSSNKTLPAYGNVLIAGYDRVPEYDVEGNITNDAQILWTWHLWLTEQVRRQGYANGFVMQDRNLGAISATPTTVDGITNNGCYYQWGRPTPFLLPSSGAYGAAAAAENKVPGVAERAADVQTAVCNPLVMYGRGDAQGDWLADNTYHNNMWGWVSESSDAEKTIYDPCPDGYRVPNSRMWRDFDDYETEFNTTNGYVKLDILHSTVYYPFSGYLWGGTGELRDKKNSNTGAFLWSGSLSEPNAEGKSHGLYMAYTASRTAATLSNGHCYSALSVRCISKYTKTTIHDLSEAQTANSYIVSKNGYYKFKATVRGNGVGSLLPIGGTAMAEINAGLSTTIHPSRVQILWWQDDLADANTTSASWDDVKSHMCLEMVDGGLLDSDGYATFYIDDFHKGNVILAAYDDSDREILWTWHIWLTDTPENKESGSYALMDRFLGATYAPTIGATSLSFADEKQRLATYGFYYQWGRKDPIPGAPSYNAGGETLAGSTTATSRWWQYDYYGTSSGSAKSWIARSDFALNGCATIPETVNNPMAFYTNTGSSYNAWFADSFKDGYTNPALWGYAVKDYSIQGNSFTKTMYDPCPPGYRTPYHYVWKTPAGANYYADGDSSYTSAYSYRGDERSYDGYGFVTNYAAGNFDKMWYPFIGYRNYNGAYAGVGTEGRMCTGMPMGASNTRSLYYNTTQTGQNTTYGTAMGRGVRCMKE